MDKIFLSNRSHSVKVNEQVSASKQISSGVPQAAVLYPILFALFINDMPSSIQYSKIVMFADDIKLYKEISSIEDTKNFQLDLTQLFNWLMENRLSLSINKCALQKLGKVKINHEPYSLNNIE